MTLLKRLWTLYKVNSSALSRISRLRVLEMLVYRKADCSLLIDGSSLKFRTGHVTKRVSSQRFQDMSCATVTCYLLSISFALQSI
jgi:hypothetical protein